MTLIIEGEAYQNVQNLLLGRFCAPGGTGDSSPVTREGNLIKTVDVASVSIKAFNSRGTQNGTTQSPAPSAVMFDTLQTAGIWLNVQAGGNFKFTAPGTFYPDGADTVQVEVALTLTDGTVAMGIWNIVVTKVY